VRDVEKSGHGQGHGHLDSYLVLRSIDKLRCPCQTVLAKSLDAARHQCCKCCFIMNGTSALRRAVGWRFVGGWLVGLATGSTLFAAKACQQSAFVHDGNEA
jgi:hypothetical protein